MKISKIVSTTAVSGILALTLSGVAMADDINVSNTGPNSTNDATVTNTSNVNMTSNNTATVTNDNTQTATSGDVTVASNTNASGPASSGDTSNSNTTTTTISQSGVNAPVGGMGGGTGTTGGSGGAGGQGGGQATSATSGGQGGGSLSVGGQGGGTLPVTGPQDQVDVSALRNAWQPTAPAADAIQKTSNASRALLAAGALLSLLGAFGSAFYANKKRAQA